MSIRTLNHPFKKKKKKMTFSQVYAFQVQQPPLALSLLKLTSRTNSKPRIQWRMSLIRRNSTFLSLQPIRSSPSNRRRHASTITLRFSCSAFIVVVPRHQMKLLLLSARLVHPPIVPRGAWSNLRTAEIGNLLIRVPHAAPALLGHVRRERWRGGGGICHFGDVLGEAWGASCSITS